MAHFFDCMRRQDITFDVSDLDGLSFKDYFGAKGVEDDLKRKGTFLAVYVTDNSVSQDFFIESAKENLDHPAIYKYPSPYTKDENELMYIIRITNEDMNTSTLYVYRDDGEYDHKSGFNTYEEANAYREECQRQWINHADFVHLITRDETGRIIKQTNLTMATEEERDRLLHEAGIPLK